MLWFGHEGDGRAGRGKRLGYGGGLLTPLRLRAEAEVKAGGVQLPVLNH